MWSRETISTGRAHEARPEGTADMGSEVSEADFDRRGSASCARPDPADRDGARDRDFVWKNSERPHSRFGGVPTACGYQSNRAVAERHQLANPVAGVRPLEEGVLGPAFVGKRISGRKHGESHGRDGAGVY